MRTLKTVALIAALLTVGCFPNPVMPVATEKVISAIAPRPIERATIVGRLWAPGNVVASGGGNVVSSGGGNVVSSGGGNVVSSGGGNVVSSGGGNVVSSGGGNVVSSGGGNYAVLQAESLRISEATIYLSANGSGDPIPGLPSVKTDAEGRFTLPTVPSGLTMVLVGTFRTTKGQVCRLQTIVNPVKGETTADLTAASSLVAANVLEGKTGALGDFNTDLFNSAVEIARQHLATEKLPNWIDQQAVITSINALASEVAALKSDLDELKKKVEQNAKTPEQVKNAVVEVTEQSPTPTPPSPIPSPAVSPSTPVASTAPSVAPSVAPSPVASPTPTPYLVEQYIKPDTSVNGLKDPLGMACDSEGNLYVADENRHVIRKIAPDSGKLEVLAGTGTAGFSNSSFLNAKFNRPKWLSYNKGVLYVTEADSTAIRKLDFATKTVTTLVDYYQAGTTRHFAGILARDDGSVLAADRDGNRIWKYDPGAKIKLQELIGTDTAGFQNGQGASGTFNHPTWLVAVPQSEQALVTDEDNHAVRLLTPATGTQTVGPYAGGTEGKLDGDVDKAQFGKPRGMAFGLDGTLYVADSVYKSIRRIKAGKVSTMNLTGEALGNPEGLLVVKDYLYVTDTDKDQVLRIKIK